MKNVLEFEEEKTELELLGRINNVLNLLDEIDQTIEELPEKQSNIELLRSDLEHLLEDKEMGSVGYKNIAKELEKVRKQRRHLKKAWEIIKCYQNNRNKITYKEQRPFIRNSLEVCYKELQTTYNYRLLTGQNIKELLGNEKYEAKKTTGTLSEVKMKNGEVVTRDEFEKLVNDGKSNKEIAEYYGLTASGLTRLKQRLGIPTRTRVVKVKKIIRPIGNYRPKDITLEMYNDLKEKGYNQRQMAEAWGIGVTSVVDVKKRLGIELNMVGRRVEKERDKNDE